MRLLRDRRIAFLVTGQAVNAIGSWCAIAAVWGYATYRFDAGAAGIAVLGLAWSLPSVVLGPMAGVPIDRIGPKRVLVVAQCSAAVVSLGMLAAGSFQALLGLAALHGVTNAFAEPAFQSLPPRLVDDENLLGANALLGMAEQLAIAIGPLIAAAAISMWGVGGAFVIDAATYAVGAAVLAPFAIGAATERTRTSIVTEVREGVRVVWSDADLRALLALAACVYFLWAGFFVIEPIYVREVLHRSPAVFALIQAAFGGALVVTGLLVPRFEDQVARPAAVAAAAVLSGLGAVVYVGTASVAVAFLGVMVWGVATGLLVVPLRTLVQRAAPVEAHGRVFALDSMLQNGGHLVSLPLVGLVAAAAGVQVAGFAAAAVAVGAGARMLVRRTRIGAPGDAAPLAAGPGLEPAVLPGGD